MRCEEAGKKLGALEAGELAPGAVEAMEGHLATCAICRGSLTRLRGLRALMGSLPVPATPPDLLPSILERVSSEREGSSRPFGTERGGALVVWGRVAAALAVAGAGLYLGARSAAPVEIAAQTGVPAAVQDERKALYAESFGLLPDESPGARYVAMLEERRR
jgi:hypothetical protein